MKKTINIEPFDTWKNSAEKLINNVYQKENIFRLGKNIAIVEKTEENKYIVTGNDKITKEFSSKLAAEQGATMFAKYGKFPESSKLSYEGKLKFEPQFIGDGSRHKVMMPVKDKKGRPIHYK